MLWAISGMLAALCAWLAVQLRRSRWSATHWKNEAETYFERARKAEDVARAFEEAGRTRDTQLRRELMNILRYDGTAASQEELNDE